jgi:hypothetical protein
MSLDFSLLGPETVVECYCSDCNHKHTRITREEFFSSNITHNLGAMFEEAGAYQILWRGEGMTARDASPVLEEAFKLMLADPDRFMAFDAENGWGVYENAIRFLKGVIEACREYPGATIACDR